MGWAALAIAPSGLPRFILIMSKIEHLRWLPF